MVDGSTAPMRSTTPCSPSLAELAAAVTLTHCAMVNARDIAAARSATAAWTHACTRLLAAVRTPTDLRELTGLTGLTDRELDVSYGMAFLRGVGSYDD